MNIQLLVLTIVAAVPLIWLLAGLGWLKQGALRVSLIGLILAVLIAGIIFRMKPVYIVQGAAEGLALAVWPILWAVVGAIYAYNVGVQTGNIEKIKGILAGLSGDPRVQVLILAWAFSGFLEGAAGYGTAVAIPVSILLVLGFEPMFAAMICLIGNTAPTAFGAIGIPVITLGKVTGLGLETLTRNVASQLTPLILLLPVLMVWLTARNSPGTRIKKPFQGVWGITIIAGLSFVIVHHAVAYYLGAELPAILGGIASLAAIILWLRLFDKKKTIEGATSILANIGNKVGLKESMVAWSPYIILFLLIIVTSNIFPAVHQLLGKVQSSWLLYSGPGGKPFIFHWLLTPGTLILIAAVIGGLIQGATVKQLYNVLLATIKKLSYTIITVIAIVAMAKIMSYSGMIAQLARTLAMITGSFYPFIAPFIGALGTFVTGSDTSSNVLFGQLQSQTALQLKMAPEWIAAANTAGATAGKMLSPQNIAIAATAAGIIGKEGELLNKTMKVCLVYTLVIGVIVVLF